MTAKPKILAFTGSLREKSFNRRLVKIAAAGAEAAGADVTVLELRELPLPVYDGDLEEREGLPENARTLKEIISVARSVADQAGNHEECLPSPPATTSTSLSGSVTSGTSKASPRRSNSAGQERVP